ncbi:hypothetical protein BDR26DRAFT_987783 [Obelidium mucronatum]|nr:hypothetical protein BDR26DRAFT_987783 [Obelidium mucronatum]
MIIAVFGATGRTGRHFARLALEQGHSLRCLVRTPDKLADLQAAFPGRVVAVAGSFADAAAVDAAVYKSDAVVYVAGWAVPAPDYPRGVMARLVETIAASMRAHNVRRLLFQAGAAVGRAHEPATCARWLARAAVGALVSGAEAQFADNASVIAFLAGLGENDVEWIVTRPGMLSEMPSRGPGSVSAGDWFATWTTAYVDVAEYTLAAIQDNSKVRTNDMIGYKE